MTDIEEKLNLPKSMKVKPSIARYLDKSIFIYLKKYSHVSS